MIRTAQDVLDAARARGFEVKMRPGPPPMPYLVGKFANATPALMEALKAFRVEILELLTPTVEAPAPQIAAETEATEVQTESISNDELPDDVPEGVSLLVRAGDGTIKAYQQSKEQS